MLERPPHQPVDPGWIPTKSQAT